jgi:uncharacterized protein YjbJ (UPF0337 family)
MNRHRVDGAWKEFAGKVKQQWAAFIGNEYLMAAGRRDQIAGRMQKMYGLATDSSEQQLRAWRRRMDTHKIVSHAAPRQSGVRHLHLISINSPKESS